MNSASDLFKEVLKRAGVLFLLIGILLVLVAAGGGLPIPNAQPFGMSWSLIIGSLGGLFIIAGGVMTIVDWRDSGKAGERTPSKMTVPGGTLDHDSFQQLNRSGLAHAFRIPVDNRARLDRVCHLIKEEVEKGSGHLRLTASSGHSYLNPNGPVWESAGIGKLIESGKIRHLEVILESPFTSFAETRAIANNVTHHQWEEKQIIAHLVELLKYPNVELRVTPEAITCSLFFTSKAVYYDPYLWSQPNALGRTENNFWVFEFDKVTDPTNVNMDCYGLLEGHFEFLRKGSLALEKLLYKPDQNGKVPRKELFVRLFGKSPEMALNNYNQLTAEFHERIKKRLKDK